MNKEQSADSPRGSDSCQKYVIAPFMSYPDVVIACIEHLRCLKTFRAIEAALVAFTIII